MPTQLDRLSSELQGRYLRPRRVPQRELSRALGSRSAGSGAELWLRAHARGLIPKQLVHDGLRRFAGPEGTPPSSAPSSRHAALLFASDPAGMLAAEADARTLLRQLQPWGCAPLQSVVWRIAGRAVDRDYACSLSVWEGPMQLRALTQTPLPIDRDPWRFRALRSLLRASLRWRELAESTVPPKVERPRLPPLPMPAELVGRRIGELDDPFEPWLALWGRGYALEGLLEGHIRLAAPERPARHQRERAFCAAEQRTGPFIALGRRCTLWSQRTSALRLAAARGDLGTLREQLPLLPRVLEPEHPPLASFAVYGGAAPLAQLREQGWLELEARDAAGATPLMYAAGLPPGGPVGASPSELDVPVSALLGAEACTFLARAGADLEAVDARGRTALFWAVAHEREACVDALLAAGAKVDARDARERTPLMLAFSKLPRSPKPWQLMQVLGVREAATPPIIEALLAAQPDVDLRDHYGWTALHYIADATGGAGQRHLARRLVEAGALPSRDRVGLTPAQLCRLRGVEHDDKGPFDTHTGSAAGPGPWPRLEPPQALVDRLVAGLWRLPPIARDHRWLRPRAQLEDWHVWADWLQSHGDRRGQLVAASLACLARRSKRYAPTAARLRAQFACAAQRERAIHRGVHGLEHSRLRSRERLGFITSFDPSCSNLSAAEQLASAGCLLAAEPLLCELRIGGGLRMWPSAESEFAWTQLLAGLAELPPHPGLRRLVLVGLPAQLPELAALHPVFPGLASLVLYPRERFEGGRLAWPGLLHLRIHHHPNPADDDPRIGLYVEQPQLTHLELGLRRLRVADETPLRSSYAASLSGFIDALPQLEHLRISPAWPGLLTVLLGSARAQALRSLEFGKQPDDYTDQLLGNLIEHAELLTGIEALTLVAPPRDEHGGALLRAALPQLRFAAGHYR